MAQTTDQGDEAARRWFRTRILPLESQLLAQARRLGRSTGLEPEDLVHETFARIISLDNWAEIDSPLAFALKVMRNLALNVLRRRKVVAIDALGDIDALGAADDGPDPEAAVLARDELRFLQTVIAELPPQCRRVFTLRKIYNLSIAQIAAELGITVSTAEKHLTKGLRICSERLARRPMQASGREPGARWRRRRQG